MSDLRSSDTPSRKTLHINPFREIRVCRECGRAYRYGEAGSAEDESVCGKCFPWHDSGVVTRNPNRR